MSEKIAKKLIIFFVMILPFGAFAADDDYTMGIKAYNDGMYSIAAMGFEQYLKNSDDQVKADYSRYLLYHIYMKDGKYDKAYGYFKDIKNPGDPKFDVKQMADDNMIILTNLDCSKAQKQAASVPDDDVLDIYLSSKCPVDAGFVKLVLAKSNNDKIKLRAVTRVDGNPVLVGSIFDSMDMSAMSDSAKSYFGQYFYKNNDYDRFKKIRSVYENADMAGMEIDHYWTVGDKKTFIEKFSQYSGKYNLGSQNSCRAIDMYNDAGRDYNCDIVDICMTDKNTDYVKLKGACYAKKADKKNLTAFIDGLNSKLFQGICAYGEYIFANGLYTGKGQALFTQCENKYNIADVMLQRQQYGDLTSMFAKPESDVDRYYAAIGLKGLGKDADAERTAMRIKDPYLKAKLSGKAK